MISRKRVGRHIRTPFSKVEGLPVLLDFASQPALHRRRQTNSSTLAAMTFFPDPADMSVWGQLFMMVRARFSFFTSTAFPFFIQFNFTDLSA